MSLNSRRSGVCLSGSGLRDPTDQPIGRTGTFKLFLCGVLSKKAGDGHAVRSGRHPAGDERASSAPMPNGCAGLQYSDDSSRAIFTLGPWLITYGILLDVCGVLVVQEHKKAAWWCLEQLKIASISFPLALSLGLLAVRHHHLPL